MEVLTVEQDTRLLDFWDELIPRAGAEQPWLFGEKSGKRIQFTWKDARAQAHCIAAYLMDKGLKKGDAVGIISTASPFYLVVDIALQFLGALNVTFPPDTSLQTLKQDKRSEPFRFFFVESAEMFTRLDQLKHLKNDLKEVILQVDDAEGLDPDKLVTFDRVVVLGKVPWREQLAELNGMKAAVSPDEDVYGQIGKRKVTFKELRNEYTSAVDLLTEKSVGRLLSLHDPYCLIHRTFGYYAPMKMKLKSWAMPGLVFSFDLLKEVQPEALVLSPAQLDGLYTKLEEECTNEGGNLKRGLIKSQKVREKRAKFLADEQKVPLFTRMAFNNVKRGFFGKVQKLFGGSLRILIVEKGKVTPATRSFFTDVGFEVREV